MPRPLAYRKAQILSASEGGRDWLQRFYPYEWTEPNGQRVIQNKGKKRKVSMKEINGVWRARSWTGQYPEGDIFAVCAAHHGLTTQGKDFVEVLKILEAEYGLSESTPISDRARAFLDRKPKQTQAQPYLPNRAHEPNPSFSWEIRIDTSRRDATFRRWAIDPATLDQYQVHELDRITHLEKGTITKGTAERPLFLFQNGGNAKAYSPSPIWGEGSPKTVYLQSSGHYVFGYDQLPKRCRAIVLAAGQKDTLALNAILRPFGIWAICLNSEAQPMPRELFADLKRRTSLVACCYDNDVTGIVSAWRMAMDYSVAWLKLPGEHNDVCDMVEAEGRGETVTEIVSQIKEAELGLSQARATWLEARKRDGERDPMRLTELLHTAVAYLGQKNFPSRVVSSFRSEVADLCQPGSAVEALARLFLAAEVGEEGPDLSRLAKELQRGHRDRAERFEQYQYQGIASTPSGPQLDTIELTARKLGEGSPKRGSSGKVIGISQGEKNPSHGQETQNPDAQAHAGAPPQSAGTAGQGQLPLHPAGTATPGGEGPQQTSDHRPTCTCGHHQPQKLNPHLWLLRQRKVNKAEVKKLNRMIRETQDQDARATLGKIASKKATCSYFFVGRELPTAEVFKIGSNLCKHKACQVCSYIVSRERKGSILRYLAANREIWEEYHRLKKVEMETEGLDDGDLDPAHVQDVAERLGIEPGQIEKHLELDFSKLNFYHLGLTLQHDRNNRTGDYSEELIEGFKSLRDSTKRFVYGDGQPVEGPVTKGGKKGEWYDTEGRRVYKQESNRTFWKKHVSGGFYSMEVIGNQSQNPQDHSLHIHLHVILATEQSLEETDFEQEIRRRWKAISGGDSDQVQLARAYRLDEEGNKIEYQAGDDPETLDKVLSETCKYSLKMDFETLDQTDGETLASLLTSRKRFFNFFGCFYGRGITTFDYKDLEEVELSENEIVSPSTGEIFRQGETQVSITTLPNVAYEPIHGHQVYRIIDERKKIIPNVRELPGEIASMTPHEFGRRLRERALNKVQDGIDAEAYAALLDELQFTGEMFHFVDPDWVPTMAAQMAPMATTTTPIGWEREVHPGLKREVLLMKMPQLYSGYARGVLDRLGSGQIRPNGDVELDPQAYGKPLGCALIDLMALQADPVDPMKEEVQRKQALHTLAVLRGHLQINGEHLTKHERERYAELLAEAEAKAGIRADQVILPVLDDPEFEGMSRAFLEEMWRARDRFGVEWKKASEIGKFLLEKQVFDEKKTAKPFQRQKDEDLDQVLDAQCRLMPHIVQEMRRSARHFEMIHISDQGEIGVDGERTYQPLGCKIIELKNLMLDYAEMYEVLSETKVQIENEAPECPF